ncbi:zinc-binding dehydrogenase [Streptomyces sp. WMMC500]|uniref:quinone oxidoreductase family protein n=1 Tax=Streptomyces sp. WMMC500 TaxID=3015154 RepID=UPI00248C7711|nr:zinc-binding dehydrogenase [Streptomyces sp. WMMC500]WBB63668.1 zinc-binding dehydrogenase [Streptomyces sp. WMMC500]
MHAAVVTDFGSPDVFEPTELPDPVPGPGQVTIDVTHAAVGLIDVYLRQGLYKGQAGLPEPPYVPGLEVAGTVRALGEGVEGLRAGEPVVTLSGTGAEGGYASVAVADAAMTTSLDGLDGAGVDPALAVAAVPNAATAYLALTEVAHLKPGEHVLVHGALGGLASAFPGVARTLGAAGVTGTVRRTSLERARASALPYDEVLAADDFAEALGDRRFDVVVDPVGGQVRTDSLRVMAPMGRMLLVGNAGGDWEHTVPTNTLWGGNLAVLGYAAGFHLPRHPELARPAARAALEAIGKGLVQIDVQTLPLSQAAEAHRRIERGSVGGRIVLTP